MKLVAHVKKVKAGINPGDTVTMRCTYAGFEHEIEIVVRSVEWFRLTAESPVFGKFYPAIGKTEFNIAEEYSVIAVNGKPF